MQETTNTTLKGREIYSQITIATNIEQPQTNKRGQDYYTYSHAGIAFTVPTSFHEQYNNGELAEVTLTKTTRQIADVDAEGVPTGEMLPVPAWQFTGAMNYNQAKNIAKNDAQIAGAQLQVAKELGINSRDLAIALMGASAVPNTVDTEVVPDRQEVVVGE